MEKIRYSKKLKIISYILIPILVLICFFSMLQLSFIERIRFENSNYFNTNNKNEKENIANKSKISYENTDVFSNEYISFIKFVIQDCVATENGKLSGVYINIKKENGISYNYVDTINLNYPYYTDIGPFIEYIIVNKETKETYTNIKSDDYEKIKNDFAKDGNYWEYLDNKIYTNMEGLNEKNIIYNDEFKYLNQDYTNNKDTININNYDIYSRFNINRENVSKAYSILLILVNWSINHQLVPIILLPITILILLVIGIYLLWSIGYDEKNKKDKTRLGFVDKIPYEIIIFIGMGLLMFFLSLGISFGNGIVSQLKYITYMSIILFFIIYFLCYIICAIIGISTIKRIRSHQFLKYTLTYKIWEVIKLKRKKIKKGIIKSTRNDKKIFGLYWGFIAISSVVGTIIISLLDRREGFALLLSMVGIFAFWIWTYSRIKMYKIKQEEIAELLKNIYEGKTDIKINKNDFEGTLKEMATYINDISEGFSKAISEGMKSERLKTELITNVSHDIKTPLTSIINYVDLLKKENIKDPKIKEYLDVLDKKSQRLKKLIEDLVEASKASSGNIKLNKEVLNLKELINQVGGEFEDKFENRKLKVVKNFPNEDVKILADSRYLYRTFENIYSNIYKYAEPKTRVYIDMKLEKNNVEVEIKNISKDELNISADELMQRFVRGDRSRNTEGSGLGLSIAQSLVELQGGKFKIELDGDLFKAILNFNVENNYNNMKS